MAYYTDTHCTILWSPECPDGHTAIAVLRHLRSLLLYPDGANPVEPVAGITLALKGDRGNLLHHLEPAIHQCLSAVVERLDGAHGVESVIAARALASKPNREDDLIRDLDAAIARLTISQSRQTLAKHLETCKTA